jgi:hypothetical protein
MNYELNNVENSLSFMKCSEVTNTFNNKFKYYNYSGSIHSFRSELLNIMKNPIYRNIYPYIITFKELLPRILITSLNAIIIITDKNDSLYFINNKSIDADKVLIFNISLLNNNIKI